MALLSNQKTPTEMASATPQKTITKRRGVTTDLVILNTAEKLFAKFGYDGVSTKLLAKEAGVTIGALYHYFPSKKSVYQEVTKNIFAKKSVLPKKFLESTESSEVKLAQLVAWFVGNITSDKNFGLLLQRELLDPRFSGSNQLVMAHFSEAYQIFRGLLKELLPTANQDIAYVSLLALCFGFADLKGKGIQTIAPDVDKILSTPEEIGRHATWLLLNGFQ